MRAKEGWRAAWLESSLGMEGKEWRASKTKCVDVSHKGYPKSQPIEDRGRKDSELNISLGYTVRPCLHRKKMRDLLTAIYAQNQKSIVSFEYHSLPFNNSQLGQLGQVVWNPSSASTQNLALS